MSLKPKKTYPILVQAVEEGVAYGLHRAYKHADIVNNEPTEYQIKDAITNAVINEIFEWFDIDDGLDNNDEAI